MLQILQLNPDNFNTIAATMDNGVSADELDEMYLEDDRNRKHRYFIAAHEVWMFVEEDVLENLLAEIIRFTER